MKALVVYDSKYGNTERIARAIAAGLGDAALRHVADVRAEDVDDAGLLVVGSPTQGGRPTPALQALLDRLREEDLKGKDVAAFDTRIDGRQRNFLLRGFLGIIGYAAPRIARRLEAKGGRRAAPPEGFVVDGAEGPLRAGEQQRAEAWAKTLPRAA